MSNVSSESGQSSTKEQPGMVAEVLDVLRRRSAATESGSPYNGVGSYAAEYHAPAVGFAVGYAGTQEQARMLITYALGVGGARKRFSGDSHIRDVADEPAYALAALAAGRMLRHGNLAVGGLV